MPPKVLAIVQAGGQGGRLDVLTRERAKPTLPFAGIYQLLDFPMSNLLHSGIQDVWLSVQYQSDSVEEQAANGRAWDLDRTHGGFRLMTPRQGAAPDAEGFAAGNAEQLFHARDEIANHGSDLTVVLSADHVYTYDYNAAIEAHLARQAECTIVTTTVAKAEAVHHTVVSADRQGRVKKTASKPAHPTSGVIATEIFVYDTGTLVELLDQIHHDLTATAQPDPKGLGDFDDHLVPRFVKRGRTFTHAMPGYWRDLGRPEMYMAAHVDLLAGKGVRLDDPAWPIRARLPQRAPAYVADGARIADSILSPGASVAGVVRRSVIGPGVTIEAGASVSDSIVFADVRVESGAKLQWAIVDSGTTVARDARIGGRAASATPADSDLTLVGKDSHIGRRVKIDRGARLEPGTHA
jgi:glucose-1-phosphate adenylyltransferase